MRIVGGEHKGRKLQPPVGRTTRPITDRVKVSLFDTLAGWMDGAAVADLFCGTGSMGLEALSRGARHCWFAEADRQATERLRRNIEAIRAEDRSTIWQGDLLLKLPGWLETLPGPLDVVFLDPPYLLAEAVGAAGMLAMLREVLASNGVIVFRAPAGHDPTDNLAGLERVRRREYGSMALNYLQHPDAPEPAER